MRGTNGAVYVERCARIEEGWSLPGCDDCRTMEPCIYCGSDRVRGRRSGKKTCSACGQEQPRRNRKLESRQALDEFIRGKVGDDHDYDASGYGPCRVCGLAEFLHHPGFSRRQE
jgi:hypothetical protein